MKETTRQEKGITLIALVLTIIVLMILAAVGIATLTGDNGILTTAQEARETKKVADIEEQLKLAQLNSKIDKETGKKVSIENYIKELENAGLEIDYDDTTQEGIVSIIIEGKYIYEISQTEKGDIKYDSQGQVGKQKPKVVSIEILEKTETKIKVKVTTLRNNEGKLRYYIKEENAVDYALIEEQEGEEFTFDNLNPKKTYSKIKVEAKAPNGETGYLEIEISNIPSLETTGAVTLSYTVNGRTRNWSRYMDKRTSYGNGRNKFQYQYTRIYFTNSQKSGRRRNHLAGNSNAKIYNKWNHLRQII